MMDISQNDRLIRIAGPLDENAFVVLSFGGIEEISGLFRFTLELASDRNDITFDALAGKNVTVGIKSSDNTERYFNGLLVAFSPVEIAEQEGFSRYRAIMQPALWLLTQCHDCRIFQDKSVPDVLRQILDPTVLAAKGIKVKIDYRLDLAGSYNPQEYCVQYNESDFDFIARICENEGIHYYFKHENGRHILVFCDTADKHEPHAAGQKETVAFQKTLGANLDRETITALSEHIKLSVGKYTARDYNFAIPNSDLTVTRSTGNGLTAGHGERYEYPGGYEKTDSRGQTLARIRMEESDAQIHALHGRGNCRGFMAGCRFTLGEHPSNALNGQNYVLTRVRHEAKQDLATGAASGDFYFNIFACIPQQIPYRPRRKTDKPVIASSQTAIVTGPAAEEIHTDKHGRVKVKFFWDRRSDEKKDGNMSCWIRVSQNWAGGKWGAMHIPRVGQEVIVNFLDGDPNRPIITGRVYHGNNLPPYNLPAEKTKSTIMSSSSKNGGNSNEIRFEDLKGEEEFYTHAAKDQNEVVENDLTTTVKANQAIEVQDNRGIRVVAGNETLTIDSGGREVMVKSSEKHTNGADFRHKVSGNYTLRVNGDITIDASGTVSISGAKIILNG